MRRVIRNVFFSFVAVGIVLFVLARTPIADEFRQFFAGIFFVDSITERELLDTYARARAGNDKLTFLVVPGHDDEIGGSEARGPGGVVREADLTRMFADELVAFLRREKEFEVRQVRTAQGYDPEFLKYFAQQKENIKQFRAAQQVLMESVTRTGLVERRVQVAHNVAPNEMIRRLYGINKWANEHDIDIVLHLHFNDYPHRRGTPGIYSGFTIYVPDRDLPNAKASAALAQSVARQFERYFPSSDMPQEDDIVPDQDLIAIGTNASLNGAGLLIEGGYIYEIRLTDPAIQPLVLKELAFQTYLGIKQFFTKGEERPRFDTTMLPYTWRAAFREGGAANRDVFALQTALVQEGAYPPPGFDFNRCPVSGKFRSCTTLAVTAFQRKHNLAPTGIMDEATRTILNSFYGE